MVLSVVSVFTAGFSYLIPCGSGSSSSVMTDKFLMLLVAVLAASGVAIAMGVVWRQAAKRSDAPFISTETAETTVNSLLMT